MDRILNRLLHTGLALSAAGLLTANSALASGNADHGKELFAAKCALCHTTASGGGNKLGPDLFGIVGRHSASVANFNYSPAMKAANIIWTDDKLATYLAGPQKMIPGVRMTFAGFTNPADSHDVVAYLSTLK